jgi:hypothetical protein
MRGVLAASPGAPREERLVEDEGPAVGVGAKRGRQEEGGEVPTADSEGSQAGFAHDAAMRTEGSVEEEGEGEMPVEGGLPVLRSQPPAEAPSSPHSHSTDYSSSFASQGSGRSAGERSLGGLGEEIKWAAVAQQRDMARCVHGGRVPGVPRGAVMAQSWSRAHGSFQ